MRYAESMFVLYPAFRKLLAAQESSAVSDGAPDQLIHRSSDVAYRCVDGPDEDYLPPCLDGVDFQVILPQHGLPSGVAQQLADALATAREGTTTTEPFTDWRVSPEGLVLLRRLPPNSRNHWQAVIGQSLGRNDEEDGTCCSRCAGRHGYVLFVWHPVGI